MTSWHFEGVVGIDTREFHANVRLVRLEIPGEEFRLADAQTFGDLKCFKRYWNGLQDDRVSPVICAEQHRPDPHGILDFLESRGHNVEKRFIEPYDHEYEEDLIKLGVEPSHRRAAALSLAVIHDFQAYLTTQNLVERILAISKELRAVERCAGLLLIANGGKVDGRKICPF